MLSDVEVRLTIDGGVFLHPFTAWEIPEDATNIQASSFQISYNFKGATWFVIALTKRSCMVQEVKDWRPSELTLTWLLQNLSSFTIEDGHLFYTDGNHTYEYRSVFGKKEPLNDNS